MNKDSSKRLASSLSRIYQHMTGGEPWAILSASVSELIDGKWVGGTDLEKNEGRTQELKDSFSYTPEDIDANPFFPYGFIPIDGVWCEIKKTDEEGNEKLVSIEFEDSLFVPGMTLYDVLELGKEFDQSAVIWGSGGGVDKSYLISLTTETYYKAEKIRVLPRTDKEWEERNYTEEEGKLHPSWETLTNRDKAKEFLDDSAGGTKIPRDRPFQLVFDDSTERPIRDLEM